MKRITKHNFLRILMAPLLALSMLSSLANAQGRSLKYEVTVTNITKGMILSPALVALHKAGLDPIFRLGEPASSELAAVAEDAMLDPLMSALALSPRVVGTAIITGQSGPIMPGETASIILDAGRGFPPTKISLAGMLVTTNDGFYGLSSADAPSLHAFLGSGSLETYLVPAYDAGSEYNSESCAYIPGPPCGSPNVHDPAAAEGFVHIHEGIHGEGDLSPSALDWRNPVAKITIRLFWER